MKRYRFELALGLVLLAVFLIFWAWQNPGGLRGKLSPEEIDRYLAAVQKLHVPADEKAQALSRLRAWMQADDGKPFYNLNLMRYYPNLHRFPGSPDFSGTPEQSNARYERAIAPMLLKLGVYPTFAGKAQGQNLLGSGENLDNWSGILVVRYPSRRAFLDLLSNPAYKAVEPYKIMAVQLVLVPSTGDVVLPDATWLAGVACIIIFLAAGWARAARLHSK